MRCQQSAIEGVHHLLDAVAVRLVEPEAELLADGEQELRGRHARIQYHGNVRMVRQPREERAHDGCLAGADLASQLNEAAGLVDAVQKVREGLGVALAQIEVARVRRDRERFFDEAEEAEVHALEFRSDDTKLSRPGKPARARPRQQACPRQKAAAEAISDAIDGRIEPRVARPAPGEQIRLPRRLEVGDPDPEQSQRRIRMRGTPLAPAGAAPSRSPRRYPGWAARVRVAADRS